jgi:hypothetical protein
VLLDKWNKGFVLEEVHGLACETKALCLKKCMVGHVKLKGFACEEVCCWTSGTKDLCLKKRMVGHVKQRICS